MPVAACSGSPASARSSSLARALAGAAPSSHQRRSAKPAIAQELQELGAADLARIEVERAQRAARDGHVPRAPAFAGASAEDVLVAGATSIMRPAPAARRRATTTALVRGRSGTMPSSDVRVSSPARSERHELERKLLARPPRVRRRSLGLVELPQVARGTAQRELRPR
jgi:hypothetical protein